MVLVEYSEKTSMGEELLPALPLRPSSSEFGVASYVASGGSGAAILGNRYIVYSVYARGHTNMLM